MEQKIVSECKNIFKNNLVGVYLHGSMAMGCFNPHKSDIDLIIVIDEDISDEQKLDFMNKIVELNEVAPEKGIEMSVVKREYCKPFVYPTPYELHFSNGHLGWFKTNPKDYVERMKGMDKDLAAHFTIINKYGKTLWGDNIEDVFGEVPREAYLDSIWYDIENAKEDVLDNPMYIILNLCRVAAYVKDEAILSKKQGGKWGVKNLSPEFSNLISGALECYSSDKIMQVEDEEAQRFCEYCFDIIRLEGDLVNAYRAKDKFKE